MDNRRFKITIYIIITLFLTHCASKKEKVETPSSDISILENKINELEYIIKSNSKGDEFVVQQFVYDNIENNVSDHSKTIIILKS